MVFTTVKLLALASIASLGSARNPTWQDCISPHSAQYVISRLNLTTSAEGGYYYQTFEDPTLVPGTNRSVSTAIFYLLEGSEGQSAWHKLDAAEVWHFYAGAPLTVFLSKDDGTPCEKHLMGNDIFSSQEPQVILFPKEPGKAPRVGVTGRLWARQLLRRS
ncbi:cupin superfamily protein [Xylariaceae sp. FL0255]|nr:cupin superfamily protein [Xylariaceae sp. FL0255]